MLRSSSLHRSSLFASILQPPHKSESSLRSRGHGLVSEAESTMACQAFIQLSWVGYMNSNFSVISIYANGKAFTIFG